MYESIRVATDGSPASAVAATEAIALCASSGATLQAIYVIDDSLARTSATHDSFEATGNRALNNIEQQAAQANVPVSPTLATGDPGQAIVEHAASTGTDLIVVGGKQKSAAERFLLGNTAEAILRRAPVSVLVARTG